MGDDRPIRYIEDDKVIYRASALGACERAFVACANGTPGMPHPAWFQEVLDEGNEAEPQISAMWDHYTGTETYGQQAEFDLRIGEINGNEVFVRCHIDGAADTPRGPVLREFKKFRDSTWPKFLKSGVEVNDLYIWQVSVCMLAGDFDECSFVGGHWQQPRDSDGELLPGRITEVYGHHLLQPPVNFLAIKKRVKRIERLIAAGFDAREVDCNKSMYPCPWFKLHDEAEDDAYQLPHEGDQGEVVNTLLSEFAVKASEVKMLKEKLDAAEKQKKQLAEGIDGMLEMLGEDAVKAKKLIGAEYEVAHVRKTIKAHERAESKQDYYTIKPRKAS